MHSWVGVYFVYGAEIECLAAGLLRDPAGISSAWAGDLSARVIACVITWGQEMGRKRKRRLSAQY